MRRAASIVALCVCAAGIAALISQSSTRRYEVAAVFDNADGIVVGSQVKIAGAVVGSVDEVQLRSGPTARIVMSLPSRFRPFRRDASCTILPQGLISENYVECNPGSSNAPALPNDTGGEEATVPLSNTTVPLSLQQVINVFSMPTDERIQVMLAELGIATAGQGQNINALLLRSNPALAQAQRVLGIVSQQRAQLADGIAQTNRVLAALSVNSESIRQFIDRASNASVTAAAHAPALAASFARFPPLLRALTPALNALDQAVTEGTPVLDSLHAAAPQFNQLASTLPPFLRAGTRTLPSLTAAAGAGLSAIRASRSVIAELRSAAADSLPFAKDANTTLISVRNNGGIEAFLQTFYSLAAVTASYDQVSHFLAFYVSEYPQCLKNPAAAGCSYAYDSPGKGTIPANDPSCGPQPDEPWSPPTNCVGLTSAPPSGAIRRGRSTHARPRAKNAHRGSGRSGSGAPGAPTAHQNGRPAASTQANAVLQKLLGALPGPAPVSGAGSTASMSSLLHYLIGP